MFEQNYNPLGNVVLSTIVAAIPLRRIGVPTISGLRWYVGIQAR